MKLYKFPLGLCLTWLCFMQAALAQVSSSEGLSPIQGVVIPKSQTSEPQVVKPRVHPIRLDTKKSDKTNFLITLDIF